MPILKPIYFASLLVLALLSTAAAQESTSTATQTTSLTITANASGDRVRVTAPSSVVQMRLEVYAATGVKLFDEELRGANVFDWHLQDGQAQRVAAGDYVCLVTAKTISGKITQKIGSVTVAEKSANVRAGDSQQFTSPQAQAIGPVEADSSWTIVPDGENQTTTVIANNGTEGQMIRGRGALSFRIGDFFSGKDKEQMRLTEEGNLGLGTSTPQAKLDVAGTIRAERFVVVKPNLGNGDKTAAATQASDAADSIQPLVAGTGTLNRLAKWLETGGAGTLGDSGVTEVAGNVGIGTTSPAQRLAVNYSTSNAFPGISVSETNASASAGLTVNNTDTSGNSGILFNVGDTNKGRIKVDNAGLMTLSGSGFGNNLTINSAGKVGIGTTSPAQRLAVNYSTSNAFPGISVSETNASASTGLTVNNTDTSGNSGILFNVGDTNKGRIKVDNAGLMTLSGSGFGNNLTINSAGNVGIGTTSPASKLDVAGDINTSTQFKIGGSRILSAPGTNNILAGSLAGSNSTGSNNSFFGTFTGTNNTGSSNSFFGTFAGSNSTGSGNSFFGASSGGGNTTGQQNAFFGSESGFGNQDGTANTFIGVGAGQNNSSGAVNAFIGAFAGSTNNTGQLDTTVGYRADVGANGLNNATAIGALAQVSQSNSLVLGSISGTNFATTDTSVGIGTTAPANPFDVNGVGTQSGGVGGFGEVAARFRQRTAGTHSALSIDALSGQDAILYLAENGAAVWGIRNDSDQGGKFQIRLQSGGVNRPLFSLNPTGEVGLGTTTPNATLQVTSSLTEQVLSATSDLTTGTWFNLGNTGTSGNTWNFISTGTATTGGPGKLYIRDNNAGQVRAAIDTNGNVGIGIGNPNDRLHVVGDIRVGTGTTGCVKDADGTVLTGTCSSDIRFKRNITPFPKLLDRLVRLQPVNFYWKASEYPQKGFGSSQSFGLVAQDVEQVLPELVTEDEQGFKAVRYNKLPLLTLQGLKELKADNDSLRRENEALKQRMEAQEVRLRKLEAKLDQ